MIDALRTKLFVFALLVAIAVGLNAAGVGDWLSIAGLKARLGELQMIVDERPIVAVFAFMTVQVTALALCLPGAVLAMALTGGALFGVWSGSLIVLASLTIGDSLGFLLARYLFGDLLARRFRNRLEHIPDSAGAAYLVALRLMAVMPYFIVNIAMAFTRIPLRIFAPASFVGLIPSTLIYVSAGASLANINNASDILTPRVILALGALAVLPVAGHWAYRRWQGR